MNIFECASYLIHLTNLGNVKIMEYVKMECVNV